MCLSGLKGAVTLTVFKMKSVRVRGKNAPGKNQLGLVLTYSAVRASKAGGTLAPVPVVPIHTRATVVTKKKAKTASVTDLPIQDPTSQFTMGSCASYIRWHSPLATPPIAWGALQIMVPGFHPQRVSFHRSPLQSKHWDF